MSLTPDEITRLETLVDTSRLNEVLIEQDGERHLITGRSKNRAADHNLPVRPVKAPVAGTLSLGRTQIGQVVSEGEEIARVRVLAAKTSVLAPVSGRVSDIFVHDGALLDYGADIILIEWSG